MVSLCASISCISPTRTFASSSNSSLSQVGTNFSSLPSGNGPLRHLQTPFLYPLFKQTHFCSHFFLPSWLSPRRLAGTMTPSNGLIALNKNHQDRLPGPITFQRQR